MDKVKGEMEKFWKVKKPCSKDNTAFKGCIDVMSRLMLKYGPDVLEKIEREKRDKAHCEETDNVL